MPTELVFVGAILVAAAGVLIFVLIQRQQPAEPPHIR
jgi:preprotein translocase subunit SecG